MSSPSVTKHCFSHPAELGKSESNFSLGKGKESFLPLQKQWEEVQRFFSSVKDSNWTEELGKSWEPFKKNAKKGAKICALVASVATVAKEVLSSSFKPYIDRVLFMLGASKFVALFDISSSFLTLIELEQKELSQLAEHLQKFLANFTTLVDQTNKFALSSVTLKSICSHLWEFVLLLSIASLISDLKGWQDTAKDLQDVRDELIEKLKGADGNYREIRDHFIQQKDKLEKYLPKEEELQEIRGKYGIVVTDEHLSEIERIENLLTSLCNSQSEELKDQVVHSLGALQGRIKSSLDEKQRSLAFSAAKVAANTLLCLSGYFSFLKVYQSLSLTTKASVDIYQFFNPQKTTAEEYVFTVAAMNFQAA